MKYKFTQNVKYEGVRYKTGNEIELNEEIAERDLKDLVEKVEPVVPESLPEEQKEEADYSDKTVLELRVIAKEKGIDIKGLKKDEVIEALE